MTADKSGSRRTSPAQTPGSEVPTSSTGAASTAQEVVAQAVSATQAGKATQASAVGPGRARGHLEVTQRQERGREARASTPRAQLAIWESPADRADPVGLLLGQEASRIQELVPVRHARMAVSAFTFYRGSALVMASDLASQPRTSLEVQLCGDAHLSNFGLFGAPDRSVVFDLNDFDETHPGPFEWDVKRLATSFVLAGRDNGLPDEAGTAAAAAAAASYRQSMAGYAGKSELAIWYDRVEQAQLDAAVQQIADRKKRKQATKTLAKNRKELDKAIAKARSRDAWSVIAKITEVVDGQRRFLHQPPLLDRIDPDDAVAATVQELFSQYLSTLQEDRRELLNRYEIIDMGHKVVGVGSVGMLAFALLLRGRDDDDLLVLQVKQAQASVLEDVTTASPYEQHGQRVVAGQRLMQAASDSFLGWVQGVSGRSYYVRQLRDMKWSPDPATLDGPGLLRYAVLCGHTLARAHARSGDAIAISSYLGTGTSFDRAVTDFSAAYSRQVQDDYAAFTTAIGDARLTAVEEADGGEGLRGARRATATGGPAGSTRRSTR